MSCLQSASWFWLAILDFTFFNLWHTLSFWRNLTQTPALKLAKFRRILALRLVALVLEHLVWSCQYFLRMSKVDHPPFTCPPSYILVIRRSRFLNKKIMWRTEAVARRCSVKNVFLKDSKNTNGFFSHDDIYCPTFRPKFIATILRSSHPEVF